jgi:hypothetical protein
MGHNVLPICEYFVGIGLYGKIDSITVFTVKIGIIYLHTVLIPDHVISARSYDWSECIVQEGKSCTKAHTMPDWLINNIPELG